TGLTPKTRPPISMRLGDSSTAPPVAVVAAPPFPRQNANGQPAPVMARSADATPARAPARTRVTPPTTPYTNTDYDGIVTAAARSGARSREAAPSARSRREPR